MLRISIAVLTGLALLTAAGSADATKKHHAAISHKAATTQKAKSYAGCVAYLRRKDYPVNRVANWCSEHGYNN